MGHTRRLLRRANRRARLGCVKHDVPFAKVARRLSSADTIDVDLYRLNLRLSIYRDQLELFRRIFPRRELRGLVGRNRNQHRGGDSTGQHQNFLPLPISLYERIVDFTGLRPVFAGQIGDDPYSSALRARFPNAHFVKHRGLATFTFFVLHTTHRCRDQLVFMARELAFRIRRGIYMPVAGLYHPAARPDCNCCRAATIVMFPSNRPALLVRPARGTLRLVLRAFGLRLSAGHRSSRAWLRCRPGRSDICKVWPAAIYCFAGSGGRPPADLAQRRAAKEADHV